MTRQKAITICLQAKPTKPDNNQKPKAMFFNILKFQVDEVTGATDVAVTFQLNLNGKFVDDQGTFTTRDAAKAWLHQIQKDVFFTRVEKFLAHKKMIIENAPRGHRSHVAKQLALSVLSCNIEAAIKSGLFNACKWFLSEYDEFQMILPAMSNPSYKSSTEELQRLYDFAKKYINKPKQQAA